MIANCLLCNSVSENVVCNNERHTFFECKNCNGIFRPTSNFISNEEEKAHYEKHNNNVNDIRYQEFVSPIVNEILKDFSTTDKGLDFGSGTGPVISKMLTDNRFLVENYDLYFANHIEKLNRKYNYISCCEVMEHFKNPLQEFQLLFNLLEENGKLYCKTVIFQNQKPFESWYYKDDPTHVFIYQKPTLKWIQKNLQFKKVLIYDKLIVFEK